MRLDGFQIIPLHHIVIVAPHEPPERSRGGIVLLASREDRKPRKGTVLRAGPGYTHQDGTKVAMSVQRGDTVFYNARSGMEYEHNGKTILLINQDEILGKEE